MTFNSVLVAGFYSGQCTRVHIHVRRIPIEEIPEVHCEIEFIIILGIIILLRYRLWRNKGHGFMMLTREKTGMKFFLSGLFLGVR